MLIRCFTLQQVYFPINFQSTSLGKCVPHTHTHTDQHISDHPRNNVDELLAGPKLIALRCVLIEYIFQPPVPLAPAVFWGAKFDIDIGWIGFLPQKTSSTPNRMVRLKKVKQNGKLSVSVIWKQERRETDGKKVQ